MQAIASEDSNEAGGSESWVKEKGKQWVHEGGQWVQRVGRRYGVFGYEKRDRTTKNEELEEAIKLRNGEITARLAGDAANAVLAYGLTKVGQTVPAMNQAMLIGGFLSRL